MSYSEEQVRELLTRSEAFVLQVLPQAGKLVLDIDNTNELLMLIVKMNTEQTNAN